MKFIVCLALLFTHPTSVILVSRFSRAINGPDNGAVVQLPSFVRDDAAMQIIDNNAEDSDSHEAEDYLRKPFPQEAEHLPPESSNFGQKTEPESIHLNKLMANVTVRPNAKAARFLCDIVGQPIPKFTWYRDKQKIEPAVDRYFISCELWGCMLLISKPTPDDVGEYTCFAKNSAGQQLTSAWLLFEQPQKHEVPSRSKWPPSSYPTVSKPDTGFCQIFQSNVCVRYLAGHRVYVSSLLHQTLVEQQITSYIASATRRQWNDDDKNCLGRIMESTCYYNFPICPPPSAPPSSSSASSSLPSQAVAKRHLCRDDCRLITEGECSAVYNLLLHATQLAQGSPPNLTMDCNGLPAFDPMYPDKCLRTGYRPPVPDLTDLISEPRSKDDQKTVVPEFKTETRSPDILPVFVSFGILGLLALLLICICLIYNRSHPGYASSLFPGRCGVVRSFCGNGGGKKQKSLTHVVEMKQQMAKMGGGASGGSSINNADSAPFVGTSFGTPNLDSQMHYHQYQTPENILLIPPPESAAPPPPPCATYSPLKSANHRAFTHAFSPLMEREIDGDEKQFMMTNNNSANSNSIFSPQQEQLRPDRNSPSAVWMDQALGTLYHPLTQIQFGDRIGQGVFGPVYAGELTASSDYENSKPTSLVIKTLSPGAPTSMQTDFRREAKIMSELNHPNLLGIFGVSLQQAPWCMLFETSLYGDLHEVLLAAKQVTDEADWSMTTASISKTWPRNQKLFDSDRFHIVFQIASGMEYLSRNHFIHRDLAARNVTVGEQLLCKITDLGLARDSYAMDYYRVPAANNLLLPVRWMPIDAILYSRFCVESDVWSFGVLLWEIWTNGMRPHHFFSDADVIELIQSRRLLACPSKCPPQVYALMLDCWNEISSKRPSFEEIISRLSLCQQACRLTGGVNRGGHLFDAGGFPPSDAGNPHNSCSQSGDSGKTNSTDVSTERPISQRISSVPMPIMASLDGRTDSAVVLKVIRNSENDFALGPRPATTGANSTTLNTIAGSGILTTPPSLYTPEITRAF